MAKKKGRAPGKVAPKAAAKKVAPRKVAAKKPAPKKAPKKKAAKKAGRITRVPTTVVHTLDDLVAADLMTTDPVSVNVRVTVGQALAVLQRIDVRHLPVLDDEGTLVGMLSDRDFRPLPPEGGSSRSPNPDHLVSDIMSSDVVSVETETSAREVVDLLLDLRVGALPVVDPEGGLVGIVSYVDVLREL